MRFTFVVKAGSPRQRHLAEAVVHGANAAGDDADLVSSADLKAGRTLDRDAVGFVGVVRGRALAPRLAAGTRTVLFDKGYTLGAGEPYWRLAVDAHHPVGYVTAARRGSERAWATGLLPFRPWKAADPAGAVLVDGGSAKQRAFAGQPEDAVLRVIERLRGCGRQIIYRPKPSWRGARPIPGTLFSPYRRDLQRDLDAAHVVVTHDSNIAVDAVRAGVPCIVLGQAVARPICSTSLDDVEAPRRADDAERTRFLANLAWCQWRPRELARPEVWMHLRHMLEVGS